MRLSAALAVLCAFGAAGCAANAPLRAYEDPASAPVVVPLDPAPGTARGGTLCLFAWSERTIMGMPAILERNGYSFLTNDSYDASRCDALTMVRQTGSSAMGTSFVDVYAPHGGEKLLQVQAEGGWGPVWGFERAGRYIQSQLNRGTVLRRKLDAAKAGKDLLTPEQIAALAGPAALTRELLASWEFDKSRAAAWRAAPAVSAPQAAARRESVPAEEEAAEEPRKTSDIDALPPARAQDPRAHAVVVGVGTYREKLPDAEYAAEDAALAAKYFTRVLGVPEKNVAVLTDERATKGDFEKYFERWLPNRVEAGDTVYVYFSGHGAPNPAKGDAYLVPYDGDPTYIDQTGFAVKRLFDDLAKLPAKQVYVAMDSCFSGAGGRSVIAKGARPLVTVTQSAVPAKVTVLSASAGDQISNGYEETGHGLFTYFLLKGLKEKGALRPAFDYAKEEVSRVARRDLNADQEPQWREGR